MAFLFHKSTPTTGAVAIYNMKELLKAAGWTVLSSSDGTTYNAVGDQITTGASGAGGMANNSAWFRIQSPVGAGGQQFAIQRGTNNTAWKTKRSRTAGFIGGSPGATQMPSATDEFSIMGGGTDASPTFATFFGTDAAYRWQGGADNASPYGFWNTSFTIGGSAPQAVFVLDPLTNTQPTDADLFVIHFSASGNSGLTTAALHSLSGTSTNYRITSQIISTAPAASYAEFPAILYTTPGGQAVPNGMPVNSITGNDEAFPLILMRGVVSGNAGYKGITSIIKWTSISRTTGDTLTVSTSRDRIIMGQTSLPWDGTVPTI